VVASHGTAPGPVGPGDGRLPCGTFLAGAAVDDPQRAGIDVVRQLVMSSVGNVGYGRSGAEHDESQQERAGPRATTNRTTCARPVMPAHSPAPAALGRLPPPMSAESATRRLSGFKPYGRNFPITAHSLVQLQRVLPWGYPAVMGTGGDSPGSATAADVQPTQATPARWAAETAQATAPNHRGRGRARRETVVGYDAVQMRDVAGRGRRLRWARCVPATTRSKDQLLLAAMAAQADVCCAAGSSNRPPKGRDSRRTRR